jgi:uncharacterized protein (TIGR00730 family)
MGALADGALAAGGEVDGVIPRFMVSRERASDHLTRLHVVESMHERKARMSELSDAFVALPGGFGTLDETCEIVTWFQLGLHAKPIGFLDVEGYYRSFLEWIERAVRDGFVLREHAAALRVASEVEPLLDGLALDARARAGGAGSSR